LLRLAHAKFQKKTARSSWGPLLSRLIEENVNVYALLTDTKGFRTALCDDEVQEIFRKHRAVLERIFKFYAGADQSAVGRLGTIDQGEFSLLLKDCKLVDATLTEVAVSTIFCNIQDDDDDDGDAEMVYSEFLEAVAAMTEYKVCNPYIPLYQRIEIFLTKNIFPYAKMVKPTKTKNQIGNVVNKLGAMRKMGAIMRGAGESAVEGGEGGAPPGGGAASGAS